MPFTGKPQVRRPCWPHEATHPVDQPGPCPRHRGGRRGCIRLALRSEGDRQHRAHGHRAERHRQRDRHGYRHGGDGRHGRTLLRKQRHRDEGEGRPGRHGQGRPGPGEHRRLGSPTGPLLRAQLVRPGGDRHEEVEPHARRGPAVGCRREGLGRAEQAGLRAGRLAGAHGAQGCTGLMVRLVPRSGRNVPGRQRLGAAAQRGGRCRQREDRLRPGRPDRVGAGDDQQHQAQPGLGEPRRDARLTRTPRATPTDRVPRSAPPQSTPRALPSSSTTSSSTATRRPRSRASRAS